MMSHDPLAPAADLRARLAAEFVEGDGVSSVAVYSLERRRLSVVTAAHRDDERSEQFEAISALKRGVALSTSDVRAAAARSGRPQRARHTSSRSTRLGLADDVLFDDSDSLLAVPVTMNATVVGVLVVSGDPEVVAGVENRLEHGSVTADWAATLATIAPAFGPSWQSEAISELASALTAAATRDEMASEVLDAGLDALGAPAGSFMTMARPGVYEMVQSRNIDRRLVERWGEFANLPGRDPFSDAIDTGRAQFFPTVESLIEHYPHLWEDVAGGGHSSWAVIPFSSRPAGPIGAMGFVFEIEQGLDRAQRIAMYAVAHLAATAALRIETQRANEATLESMTEKLFGMNDIATDIDHVDTSGYYRPAGEHSTAGGDWFDVIDDPTRAGHTYVVIGDVADHGPPAVGTMVAVRAWIQSAVHDGLEPAAIADKVSHLVDSYRYPITTILIARFDPAERSITWCCAGHPPLLLADDDDVDYFRAPHGPPLGSNPNTEYQQSIRTVEKPVSIVLYSDGLLQRYDSDLTAGFVALRDTVRNLHGHQFSAADLVRRFSTPEAFSNDDVAVLVVHFTARTATVR